MNCAPILLLGFNRPELLRGLVAILAKVRPPKIYLAVDGPRPDHPGEAEKCAACAAVADAIDWPCEVKKLVREKNLGCRLGVSGAIDWFFSQEEEGIILEDDCWPDPSFLRFATELLERYRDDPRIGIISGTNLYGFISDSEVSYRFTMPGSIWGWASWARNWRFFICDPTDFLHDFETVILRTALTKRRQKLSRLILQGLLDGQDTWDMQWSFTRLRRGWLDVCPRETLVTNMGFGEGGTNTTGFSYDHIRCRGGALEFPLKHPGEIARDFPADRKTECRMFAILPRVLTIVGIKLGSFGRFVCHIAAKMEKLVPILFRI